MAALIFNRYTINTIAFIKRLFEFILFVQIGLQAYQNFIC